MLAVTTNSTTNSTTVVVFQARRVHVLLRIALGIAFGIGIGIGIGSVLAKQDAAVLNHPSLLASRLTSKTNPLMPIARPRVSVMRGSHLTNDYLQTTTTTTATTTTTISP